MKCNYSFYLVVDRSIENAEAVVESLLSLVKMGTSVHHEHSNGISTFQIETVDLVIATKIKLLFGSFILHEGSDNA